MTLQAYRHPRRPHARAQPARHSPLSACVPTSPTSVKRPADTTLTSSPSTAMNRMVSCTPRGTTSPTPLQPPGQTPATTRWGTTGDPTPSSPAPRSRGLNPTPGGTMSQAPARCGRAGRLATIDPFFQLRRRGPTPHAGSARSLLGMVDVFLTWNITWSASGDRLQSRSLRLR